MFDFQNLNDYEFELLCKDVLEAELKKSLRTYSKGKDGGIDISCFVVGGGTIAQVRHYINSGYSRLLSSLQKELRKVKLLSPGKYYVCTSLRLTHANIKKIYELFRDYMSSIKNIYDGTRIEDFLSKPTNSDIVNKHYKLWLASSSVLELVYNKSIFIDTDELMFGIERDKNLFVETEAYYQAIKIIEREKVIIIVGDPGVGKTTISKMLLLYYASKGYIIRYASDNSIKDIKNVLSKDPIKKELVFMDDFLGQLYLNLKENQPNEIKSLIGYILGNKDKKLILNSRITILNEALRRSFQLDNFLNDNEIKKYRIDLNEMLLSEKAKIFYNHIFFNKLPVDYFNEIKKGRRYIKIVSHKNYNPRIIEYVTKRRNYETCGHYQYYQYVVTKLENPLAVWKDEFSNRLSNSDRIFMHTLYSLTDKITDKRILNSCFNKRIKHESGYDSTINMFNDCLIRLSKSMVKIIEDAGEERVAAINPSVNDYIFNYLGSNENEVDRILDYSLYIEQINKIGKINKVKAEEFKLHKIKSGKFFELKSIYLPIEYHYLEAVYSNGYKDLGIKDKLAEILSDPLTYSRNSNASRLLCEIFTDGEFFSFYDLKDLLFDFNKMEAIFNALEFDDINTFLSIYKTHRNKDSKVDNKEWVEHLRDALDDCIWNNIFERVESEMEDNLGHIVECAIDGAHEAIKRDFWHGRKDPLLQYVRDALLEKIEQLIENQKTQIDSELFSLDLLNMWPRDILDRLRYTSYVENHFRNNLDDDRLIPSSAPPNDYEEVHKIFEREYLV